MKQICKKVTAVMLTVALLLVAAPLSAVIFRTSAASYSGSCGSGLTWSLDTSTGVLNISGNGGDMDYWATPENVPWNAYRSSVITVNIGNSVTSIGNHAFASCTKLTSATIGTSVKSIGDGAFSFCTALKSITIPSSVTSIGMGAFSSSAKITSITVPDSVTSIGDLAFEYCTALKTIKLPDHSLSIGEDAFKDCGYYSTSGNWANNVLYIGNHLIYAKNALSTAYTINTNTKSVARFAFADTKVTSFTVPTDNTAFTSVNGVLFSKDQTTLVQYPMGNTATSYSIPATVKNIAYGAFAYATKITSLTIPTSMTKIDDGAFTFLTKLTSVTIPDSVKSIGADAFAFCLNMTSATVGASVKIIGNGAFYCCKSLKTLKIGAAIEKIEDNAFDFCFLLSKVTYGSSKEDWNLVTIGGGNNYGNDYLKKARFTYTGTGHSHSYTSVVTKDATCSAAGVKTYTCRCGDSYTEEIPKLNHNYQLSKTIAATCITDGYDLYKCTLCGGEEKRNVVEATGHSHTSEVTKAATCTATGIRTYTCVCGDTYTETIPKLTHNYQLSKTIAATCITDGYDLYKCTLCGGEEKRNVVEATGHDYNEGVCGNCGELLEIVTPDDSPLVIDRDKKLISGIESGIDVETFLAALTTADDYTVTLSSDVVGTGTVVAIMDNDGNVVDSYTMVVFGDYNGDGCADMEDTAYFSSIANFEIFDHLELEYLFMAADINGDGVVDTMDEEDMYAVSNYEAYIDHTITEGSKVVRY